MTGIAVAGGDVEDPVDVQAWVHEFEVGIEAWVAGGALTHDWMTATWRDSMAGPAGALAAVDCGPIRDRTLPSRLESRSMTIGRFTGRSIPNRLCPLSGRKIAPSQLGGEARVDVANVQNVGWYAMTLLASDCVVPV